MTSLHLASRAGEGEGEGEGRGSWADEELVDPKKYLEERCKPQCVKPLYEYEKCVKRVEKDDTGHKHCTGQYFDYWSCIDKCVAPKLLEKLK
uniref:Complex III subunit VI n=1 Tax=Oryza punctata TaxID=4537 RepID=A0A0E0MCT3_ORYPU